MHGGLHQPRQEVQADDSGAPLAGETREGPVGLAGRHERRGSDADSASDVGHSAGGEIGGDDAAARGRKELAFCECGRPLPREIGEHPRRILRLSNLRSDAVGTGERTRSQGRSYAGTGAGQSSSGGDGAQT